MLYELFMRDTIGVSRSSFHVPELKMGTVHRGEKLGVILELESDRMENGISTWSASHTHVVDHVDPEHLQCIPSKHHIHPGSDNKAYNSSVRRRECTDVYVVPLNCWTPRLQSHQTVKTSIQFDIGQICACKYFNVLESNVTPPGMGHLGLLLLPLFELLAAVLAVGERLQVSGQDCQRLRSPVV